MGAKYLVRDIRDGIVSEGAMSGKKVVEVIFGGCNHWDGEPSHRKSGTSACSMWCDANFNSYCSKAMTAIQIADKCREVWVEMTRLHRNPNLDDYILLTGGEPLMFADLELAEMIRDHGFQLMIETNGTIRPSNGLMGVMSYISVRPKLELCPNGELKVPDLDVLKANELVITLPGAIGGKGWTDEQLYQVEMEGEWGSMYVVPMDPTDPRTTEVTHLRGGYERHEELNAAVQRCLDWVRENPKWRICIQLHKVLNL